MTALTGVEVVPLNRPEAVVERSDIVSTATTSTVPVFDAGGLHPGLHINAIGAHRPSARELDAPTILASRLFADDLVRSRQEDGEILLLPPDDQLAALERSVALGDVVAGHVAGRASDAEITAFLSGGLSSEYLWTAVEILRQARDLGLGTLVSLG